VFERFTERSRQVVVLAQDEARALRHDYIGTEHLLLGLLREEEGIAAQVLDGFDITVEEVRAQIERIVGQGDEPAAGEIPFTPRAKKVLERALRQALSLQQGYIGTEHVLLGLIEEPKGVALRILHEFDAEPDRVRREVLRMLSGPAGLRLRSGAPTPRPWEYRVETLEDGGALTTAYLEPLGAEGWELVAIVGEPPGARLVFKRPPG